MKATFSNTVDILVKAYLNDTLRHCNCYACAVGNIISSAMGYRFVQTKVYDMSHHSLTWDVTHGKWVLNC